MFNPQETKQMLCTPKMSKRVKIKKRPDAGPNAIDLVTVTGSMDTFLAHGVVVRTRRPLMYLGRKEIYRYMGYVNSCFNGTDSSLVMQSGI